MISIYSSKDHRWRDAYNPLRGLSLPKLVGLLEAGERGQYADLQWLYYYMERSDPMVFAILQRRRAALLSCDWDIREVSECGSVGVSGDQGKRTADDTDGTDGKRGGGVTHVTALCAGRWGID